MTRSRSGPGKNPKNSVMAVATTSMIRTAPDGSGLHGGSARSLNQDTLLEIHQDDRPQVEEEAGHRGEEPHDDHPPVSRPTTPG